MSLLKIVEEGRGCETPSKGRVQLNVEEEGFLVGTKQFQGKAAIVTLGCAKNQVDSEVMLGVLRNNGYEIVADLSEADVAIINTCGFLESAVKESIDAILDAASYKEKGRLRRLIVAGCMVERYRDDLVKSLPEVDGFMLLDEIVQVGNIAKEGGERLLEGAGRPYFLYDDTVPRQLASASHTAYVKVSEGCNRPCTFCIIPRIRGGMRSRTVSSVVREVEALGAQGVREINLVAQDLTSFGTDRKEGENLSQLLHALDASKAVEWVRLLYAYPIGIDEELLKSIEALPRICNYLDLPLQHSSEAVLRAMKRPIGRYAPRNLIPFIRATAPQVHLRTTFIVGFPGETEEDIDDLEQFILDGHFSSVGIFTYSPEQGTPAFELAQQIPEKVKRKRRERLMKAQQRVIAAKLEGMIGQEFDVLIEGVHEETDLLLTARTQFQAPDVDGTVIINDIEGSESLSEVPVGQFGKVRITEVAGYDLVGTLLQS